jgi:hypothetical protein
MRRKEIKLPMTPITESTFERQGWRKISVNGIEFEDDANSESNEPYYFSIALPKDRDDEFAPMLVSNISDEGILIKDIGLKPGQYFIEIMDMDGLGFCASEEELSVLYTALTGDDIEENLENSK